MKLVLEEQMMEVKLMCIFIYTYSIRCSKSICRQIGKEDFQDSSLKNLGEL